MYHIPNDKRAKKSAELIWKGMEKCLQEKSFDKLKITDIYQKSYVSRATFYRLFDTIQDVLKYKCDCIYSELEKAENDSVFKSKHDFFLNLIEKWIEQEILIKTLVENNMIDIIYETHMKNQDFMKRIFLKDVTVTDKEADYLVSLLINIIPAAVNVWYSHGKNETPEEIFLAVRQSINIINTQLF